MDYILDLQDLELPEAQSNAMAHHSGGGSGHGSGHGGGHGSTTASNVSLLLSCSHSGLSLLLC